MNVLDRAIAWVSPKAGARRQAYRQYLASYDGASKGRRTEGWRTHSTSATAEIRGSLTLLRNRSRDLVRNNPYAAAAVREIPAHMVGEGIIPQAQGARPEDTQRLERLVKAWFDTPACDADGRHDFYGIQNLVARTVVEAGECLVRMRRRNASDRLPVPMQLQVLEPDHLDTMKDGHRLPNGNRIIQGVEFNGIGRRVAYWLFPDHPGDTYWTPASIQSRRIPAEEIIHVYRMDRPGQVRGVPWSAPIIIKLRDFSDYEDAQLMRQKTAACFAAFVYNDDAFSSGSTDTELPEKIEPGMLEELPGGKRIEFSSPPAAEGYEDYSLVTLHSVATGFGVPYSVLTGDLRQVNFSSGRMGWLSFNRNIAQWRANMLIPQLCRGVWDWFIPLAQLQAGVGRAEVTWTAPRRELVDPSREIPAIRDAVRSGVLTQDEAIREAGYDPADFYREVAETNRRMDELGLVFDSDPRRVSRAGLAQNPPPEDSQE